MEAREELVELVALVEPVGLEYCGLTLTSGVVVMLVPVETEVLAAQAVVEVQEGACKSTSIQEES